MKSTIKTTTVNKIGFEVWSDFIKRATFAKNAETGEIKALCGGGYIRNDLTVRKAIATAFGLPTFRK